jgi:hypothetical protein
VRTFVFQLTIKGDAAICARLTEVSQGCSILISWVVCFYVREMVTRLQHSHLMGGLLLCQENVRALNASASFSTLLNSVLWTPKNKEWELSSKTIQRRVERRCDFNAKQIHRVASGLPGPQ